MFQNIDAKITRPTAMHELPPIHLLAALLNILEDGLLCVSDRERIVYLNRVARRLTRSEQAEMSEGPIADFPGVAELLVQVGWEQLKLAPSPLRTIRTLPSQRTSEGPLPLAITIQDTVLVDQRLFVFLLRDESRRQQMDMAFHQSEKTQAISALAAGIAHDFNNILTGILSHIDLALYAKELPDSLRDYLLLAQTSARRGAELIGKLATFSRRSEPKLKPIPLGSTIEEAAATLQRTLGPKFNVSCLLPRRPQGYTMADESQIAQVLISLGMNASEAMPQGGQITLSLNEVSFREGSTAPRRRLGDFTQLTVSDTGEGIPPDQVNRMFEPYFTTKSLGKTTGLGLSIAYNIVKAHQGWMEVESQPGKGTQYHIFLPRASQPVPSAAAEPPPAENPPTASGRVREGHERILVADDEDLVRLVVRAVLTFRGYQVVEADSGEEALRKFTSAETPIDLALLDVHMAGADGWDTLRLLRQHKPDLSAILLSGAPSDSDLEQADRMGNVAFLAKPFDNHDLAGLVRRMLDAKPAENKPA
ncbi:MAG TPA: response regulator [Verrucomicrobiota bacterium]|nr:response regulator [Verrucomicrobiota bacterium]